MLYTNHDTADRGGSGGGGRRGRVGIPLGGPPPFMPIVYFACVNLRRKVPKRSLIICCYVAYSHAKIIWPFLIQQWDLYSDLFGHKIYSSRA